MSLKLSIETEHAGELKQALGELTSGSVVITA
ncbi:hypothetical protein [Marispirochaeta aestuarii]|nr:hypothetical protein [Marispirochaeta aestuarii]